MTSQVRSVLRRQDGRSWNSTTLPRSPSRLRCRRKSENPTGGLRRRVVERFDRKDGLQGGGRHHERGTDAEFRFKRKHEFHWAQAIATHNF